MANFPELVAPQLPNSVANKAPEILLEGLKTGLAAYAQFAQMRRQQESDIAHLALQERLTQEQHDIERQRLDQAAQLIPSQIEANKAHATLMTEQGQAAARGITTAAGIKLEAMRKNEALMNEAVQDVHDLQLEDEEVQTKKPVLYGRNVEAFAKKYQFSPNKDIRAMIRQYRSVANEQKVMLKHGVADEAGNVTPSGQGVHVPLWKVAEAAANPTTQDQTFRDLEASGYIDLIEQVKEVTGFFSSEGKPKYGKHQQTTKTRTLREPVKSVLESVPPATPVDYGTTSNITPQDQEALTWAYAHPNDPRAAAIFKKLGVQ